MVSYLYYTYAKFLMAIGNGFDYPNMGHVIQKENLLHVTNIRYSEVSNSARGSQFRDPFFGWIPSLDWLAHPYIYFRMSYWVQQLVMNFIASNLV